MGWFETIYDQGIEGVYGSLGLPEELREEATALLCNVIGQEETRQLIKKMSYGNKEHSIDNIFFIDWALNQYPHSDIPTTGKERIEYFNIAMIIHDSNDGEGPFFDYLPVVMDKYVIGTSFKQFSSFMEAMRKVKGTKFMNTNHDYEFSIFPTINSLLDEYGREQPITQQDFGGIKEESLLYLPRSSPTELAQMLNQRLKIIPKKHYLYTLNISKEQPTWQESLLKDPVDSGTVKDFYGR